MTTFCRSGVPKNLLQQFTQNVRIIDSVTELHTMAFFRSYILPFLIVVVFLVAMVAVSARIFLPSDMMAPAPIDDGAISSYFQAITYTSV